MLNRRNRSPPLSTEGYARPPRKKDLERLCLVERISAMKIAKVYDLRYKNPKVAESTILYHLNRNGIKRRTLSSTSGRSLKQWSTSRSEGVRVESLSNKSLEK